MKKYYLFILVLLVTACQPEEYKDLDEVQRLNADKEYIRVSFVNMHYLTETREISYIDSLYKDKIKEYNIPVSAVGCKDGVFSGTSLPDAYGYRHIVKIEIKNEKIISIDYDEVNSKGIGKRNDAQYNEDFSVMGTMPKEFYPVYENQLIEKQNIMKIDGVSGASYSLYRLRYALMIALIKARNT